MKQSIQKTKKDGGGLDILYYSTQEMVAGLINFVFTYCRNMFTIFLRLLLFRLCILIHFKHGNLTEILTGVMTVLFYCLRFDLVIKRYDSFVKFGTSGSIVCCLLSL